MGENRLVFGVSLRGKTERNERRHFFLEGDFYGLRLGKFDG